MTEPTAAGQAPYTDLFIYHLQGNVGPRTFADLPQFIGNWHEDGCSFLFFSAPASAQVQALTGGYPGLVLLDSYHMSYEQWLGERPARYRAGRFRVSPPWQALPDEQGPWDIVLDPGVVFGTGTHPTTRRCLEALEWIFEQDAIGSAIDCGTGTGLLALAAAKLGCPLVLAVDTNPLCTRTAARNADTNRLADRITVVQGRAEALIACRTDLAVANIHYDALTVLVAAAGFRQKRWFILSGLLASQYRRITDQLAGQGARIIKYWDCDGVWFTICGKNGDSAQPQ
jgi:ribosomal protein L11 methyltransferase